MKIEATFTVAEAAHVDLDGATVVMIDVVRASTTMITALDAGASGIYPAGSNEDAARLLQAVGREGTLLAGERNGLAIEGYHLGNSPAEFTPEAVADHRIVLNTSNGTRALLAAESAERVLVGGFLNLSAVVRELECAERVLLLCAGRNDRFALDDAICAGHFVQRLVDASSDPCDLGEGARAAQQLAQVVDVNAALLASTAAGRALIDIGLDLDLERCAHVDGSDLVPEMTDRVVRRAHGEAG
jgi:2-phosphosulfolactate phosphatase